MVQVGVLGSQVLNPVTPVNSDRIAPKVVAGGRHVVQALYNRGGTAEPGSALPGYFGLDPLPILSFSQRLTWINYL